MELNFDTIWNAERNFVYANNRRPSLILAHPSDVYEFKKLMYEKYGFMEPVLTFREMKVAASYDVAISKWELY